MVGVGVGVAGGDEVQAPAEAVTYDNKYEHFSCPIYLEQLSVQSIHV